MKFAYIGFFGVAGVYARYALGNAVDGAASSSFPYGTLGVNLLGAFLAGLVYGLTLERVLLSPELKMGILVGFLGGFTTFSALCLQSLELAQGGKWTTALLYVALTNAGGLLLVLCGFNLARKYAGS